MTRLFISLLVGRNGSSVSVGSVSISDRDYLLLFQTNTISVKIEQEYHRAEKSLISKVLKKVKPYHYFDGYTVNDVWLMGYRAHLTGLETRRGMVGYLDD